MLNTCNTRLRSWGYEPIFCSVESKMGLDTLGSVLRDQTTVIVGPSGVGKSSLINVLRDKPSSHVEDENWFEPVGLFDLSVQFACFHLYVDCVCLCIAIVLV